MYQDTVHVLRPTLVFLRLCGVCPSAVNQVKIPASNIAYAILLAILVLRGVVKALYYFQLLYNDISLFFASSSMFLFGVGVVVLLALPFSTSEELVKFFKVMRSVQKSLFSLNIRQPATPTSTMQICLIAVVLLPLIFSVMLELSINSTERLDLAVTSIVVGLIKRGMVVKISILIGVVNYKLELLNWHVKDLNRYWPPFLPSQLNDDQVPLNLSDEATRRRSKFVFLGLDNKKLTPQKVRMFSVAHLKLHYAYRKLNMIFSVPALVIYINAGLMITTQIFTVSSQKSGFTWYIEILATIDEAVGIIVISSMVTVIENNFKKTARLVHGLLEDESHPGDVINELEKFSKILLHRKAAFSAAGFFDINLKIIPRMTTLFAPIILFLVQNDNRPRAGRNKNE